MLASSFALSSFPQSGLRRGAATGPTSFGVTVLRSSFFDRHGPPITRHRIQTVLGEDFARTHVATRRVEPA